MKNLMIKAAMLTCGFSAMIVVGCEATPDHSPPGVDSKVTLSTQPSDHPAPVTDQTAHVSINSGGFSPANLTVAKGTTVIWTNDSGTMCAITSGAPEKPGGGPLSGVTEAKGATYNYKFDVPGVYPYFNLGNTLQGGTVTVNQ